MYLLSCILVGLVFVRSTFATRVDAARVAGAHSLSPSLEELEAEKDEEKQIAVNHTCTVGSYAFDTDNSTLGVYCNTDEDRDFAYDWTFIDVNLCIANDDGALVSFPEGNFSDSCQDCNVTWSHIYLTPVTTTFTTTPHSWITNTITSISTPRWDDLYLGCGCTDRDYQVQPATIDLNKVMVNVNGTIGCHTYRGTTMHAKPDPTTTPTTTTTTATVTAEPKYSPR